MDSEQFKKSIKAILAGGVIVMPTDTVFGIVCSALNPQAVERVFEVKGRKNKLGTLLFADKQQLLDFGFDAELVDIAMQYWPAPVSVVLPAPAAKEYLAKEWNSLAVRIPGPSWLQGLIAQTGPLATTSANYPNEPTVQNADEAKKLFKDQIGLYVKGRPVNPKPSKIIRINKTGKTEVLRD